MQKEVLTEPEIRDLWANYLLNKPRKDYLTLYVSIPACFERCDFCIYYRYPFLGESQLDSYLDYLEEEARFFSEIFKDFEFNAFYIGGGTPSLLRTRQISRLFEILRTNFNINVTDDNFSGFEAHPAYFTKKKIETVYKEGMINRISFGVQSFDKKVIELNNRVYVSIEKFSKTVDYLRALYRDTKLNINVDLMIGLDGESAETLLSSFSALADINILRITVYCNRKKERELGQAFREYAVNTIRLLDRYIQQNHPQYVKLSGNTDEYHEVHAWALRGYERLLFKYSYNSSPLVYNNNLGLGFGSSSFIIEKGVWYHNLEGTYYELNDIDTETFMKLAKLKRKDNQDYINTFNF